MNIFRKLASLATFPPSLSLPRRFRYDISRKEWADFALVVSISVLILIYKVNKTS